MKNKESAEFEKLIYPFFWVENERNLSVCLNVGEYKSEIFKARESEGFEGNGYDWGSLAKVFLEEQKPEFVGTVKFDPEAGMFCAYSANSEALKTFIIAFKEACENEALIVDLFSRAELD
ncbi:hypothetical protein GCM10027051_29510 [Niabella terrae]